MAYRQPRIPEYRDGAERTLRTLILFLKDFCAAAWMANNRRIREMEALQARIEKLEQAQGSGNGEA